MKRRQAGSGPPSRAGGEGKCLFGIICSGRIQPTYWGLKCQLPELSFRWFPKAQDPDVSFRKPQSHVPRWAWWWSAAPAQMVPVPYTGICPIYLS